MGQNYSQTVAHTQEQLKDEDMNFQEDYPDHQVPSSLFLSPITSNDSTYHVDHDLSPVSSGESEDTVTQTSKSPNPQKRIKNLKQKFVRKLRKDKLPEVEKLSLDLKKEKVTKSKLTEAFRQNELYVITSNDQELELDQEQLGELENEKELAQSESDKKLYSQLDRKSIHLFGYSPKNLYSDDSSKSFYGERGNSSPREESRRSRRLDGRRSSSQLRNDELLRSSSQRSIPTQKSSSHLFGYSPDRTDKKQNIHLFGYSPNLDDSDHSRKSSYSDDRRLSQHSPKEELFRRSSRMLYSDDGPLPRRSSSQIRTDEPRRSSSQVRPEDPLSSRGSSAHLKTIPTRPSFPNRRSSSNLFGYSPSKSYSGAPTKSPQDVNFRKSSSHLFLNQFKQNHLHQSTRSNSVTNLKTFKLHPSENDVLNPIDTLLSQNNEYHYPSSILNEELKIWDTSSTPDNVSIADTVESRHSDEYMSEYNEPTPEELVASPLLSLPLEILYRIIEIVYHDDQVLSINSNLENFANTIPFLTRRLNQLSLCFLYKYTIFNRPHAFDKFLRNLQEHIFIGKYVEFMDFQQFTSIGLGRTGRMMQEIQMVTSQTITEALSLTPNLIEFMASENIQDDLDVNVLDYLFNRLYKIQTIDFCGASTEKFVQAFRDLIIDNDIPAKSHDTQPISPSLSPILSPTTSLNNPQNVISPINSNEDTLIDEAMEPLLYEERISKTSSLNNLFKISFHDCTSLTPEVFIKILPHLHNIRRLDLNHTYITSAILNQYLPHTARLTHLSLSRTSKLTTKDLINFLTQHPAVANNTLQWLNIQIDSNVVSPLSDIYLNYTLKYLKASNLQYLNLGGLPIKPTTMKIIRQKFPELKSLSIAHADITLDVLNEFMKDNENIRYLDLSGMKLTRFNIISFLKRNFYSNLEAIEFDYKVLYEVTADGEHLKSIPEQQSFLDPVYTPNVWKFYDNEGRRAWIYKLGEDDPSYKDIINGTSNFNPLTTNLVYYDLETGSKITTKFKSPKFLIYASRKINCSIGYMNLRECKTKKYLENIEQEDIWPVEFSQRGIYNYYSLNVK